MKAVWLVSGAVGVSTGMALFALQKIRDYYRTSGGTFQHKDVFHGRTKTEIMDHATAYLTVGEFVSDGSEGSVTFFNRVTNQKAT